MVRANDVDSSTGSGQSEENNFQCHITIFCEIPNHKKLLIFRDSFNITTHQKIPVTQRIHIQQNIISKPEIPRTTNPLIKNIHTMVESSLPHVVLCEGCFVYASRWEIIMLQLDRNHNSRNIDI